MSRLTMINTDINNLRRGLGLDSRQQSAGMPKRIGGVFQPRMPPLSTPPLDKRGTKGDLRESPLTPRHKRGGWQMIS
jgi:hypothetical protein